MFVLLVPKVDGHIGHVDIAHHSLTEAHVRIVQTLEAADLWSIVGQMPATGPGSPITGLGEEFAHIGDGRVRCITIDYDPRFVRQTIGDQAAARGAAHRCGAIGSKRTPEAASASMCGVCRWELPVQLSARFDCWSVMSRRILGRSMFSALGQGGARYCLRSAWLSRPVGRRLWS